MSKGTPWWWLDESEARSLGIGCGTRRTSHGVLFGDPKARVRLEVIARDVSAPLQLGPVSVRVWGANTSDPQVVALLHRVGRLLHARRGADFRPGDEDVPGAARQPESDDVSPVVLIDVPSVCRRSCAFCALSPRPVEARTPRGDDARVERAIEEAGAPILFTGDDALSHPRILTWIARAKAHGPVSLVGPPRSGRESAEAQQLASAGLAHWSSGLFGTCAETHDAIAGEVGAFEALRSACEALIAAGIRVELITPMVKPLLHALPEIVAVGSAWTGRPVVAQLYVPDPSAGTSMDVVVPSWSALREVLRSVSPRDATLDGAPPCLLPEVLRAPFGRLDRSEANVLSYPAEACPACPLRARCPGIAASALRAVGSAGLG